jgi:hypothetical protein
VPDAQHQPQSDKEREAIRQGARFGVMVFVACLTLVILVSVAIVLIVMLTSE